MKNSQAFPHLLEASLLRDVPAPQKASFLDDCSRRFCAERCELLTQGEPTDGCFIVALGRIEVNYMDGEGNVSIVHIAGPGEIVGEVEALSRQPCAASCVALPNTTLLYCPSTQLLQHTMMPIFVRNFAAILHERLVRDNHQRSIDQFYTVESRICLYLCQFSTPTHPEIDLSQARLARLLGCSRQTVNRKLGELRDDGIIDMSRGAIRVLDRARLERESEPKG